MNLFDLTDRVSIVFGAGSGIGAASAQALATLGSHVLCADFDADAAERTADDIRAAGGSATAHGADLTSRADVDRVVAAAITEHGRLDVGVTTPGINIRKRLFDYTEDDFDRVIALNLKGTLFFLQAAGRVMAEQGSGSLVACSSMRATMVEPGLGVYGGTKAAIVQMVRSLAAEIGPAGVRVNAIAPGVIDTPLTRPIKDDTARYESYAAHTVFNRWGTAEEVAGAVAFLACDASTYVSGANLAVDGGWTAIDGRSEGFR
ncbi:SDR family NAD(P)-dependent oxidoreductase [Nocardia sp. NPDC127579]|uniref:SDR family NAD(P)-dependent oxidoreductase n=1 Tax=Nocardia sp. NPDC127579 TaxID=3345402 RepID=UPI00362F9D3D